MSFCICINRLRNVIIYIPIFLWISKMFNLNHNLFSCGTIRTQNIKISINIRQGTAFLKLRTVNQVIRKDIFQNRIERLSNLLDSVTLTFGISSLSLIIKGHFLEYILENCSLSSTRPNDRPNDCHK